MRGDKSEGEEPDFINSATKQSVDVGLTYAGVIKAVAMDIYQRMMEKACQLMEQGKSDEPQQLVFCPDGDLTGMPIDTLVDGNGRYMLEKFAVSTVPSAKELLKPRRDLSRYEHDAFLLIVREYGGGNPVDPNDDRGRLCTLGGEQAGRRFANLALRTDYTGLKTRNVSLFLDDDANDLAVDIKQFNRSRLVQLSGHGYADGENPLSSKILLAPNDSGQDCAIDMKAVLKQGLTTPLLVLSACRSNVGRRLPSGEVASLANECLTSGVGGVVGTLWDLTVHAHNHILDGMYQRLNNGETVAESLRGAKLDYIEQEKDRTDPYYWSCLQYIGKDQKLFEPAIIMMNSGDGRQTFASNAIFYYTGRLQRLTLISDWLPDTNRPDWVCKHGTEFWQFPNGQAQRFTLANNHSPNSPRYPDLVLKANTEVLRYSTGRFQRYTLAEDWRPFPKNPELVLKAGTEVCEYPDERDGFESFTLARDFSPHTNETDLCIKAGTKIRFFPGGAFQSFTPANDYQPSAERPDMVVKAGTELRYFAKGQIECFTIAKDFVFIGNPEWVFKADTEVNFFQNRKIRRFTPAVSYSIGYPDETIEVDLVAMPGTEVWAYPDGQVQRVTIAHDASIFSNIPGWIAKAGTEVWMFPDGVVQRFTPANDWAYYPDLPDCVLRSGHEVWFYPNRQLQIFTAAKDYKPMTDRGNLVIQAGTEVWLSSDGAFRRYTCANQFPPFSDTTGPAFKGGTEVRIHPGGAVQLITLKNPFPAAMVCTGWALQAMKTDETNPDGSYTSARIMGGSVVETYENGFLAKATFDGDVDLAEGIRVKARTPVSWHENGHVAEATLAHSWSSPTGEEFGENDRIVCSRKDGAWEYARIK